MNNPSTMGGLRLASVAGALVALAACLFPFTAPASADDGRIKAVVTIGMIGDLVENIGGDRVEVTALMGPGIDPHLYKATQGDLERLTGADIIFYNGLHLEGKMVDIFARLATKRPCHAVTAGIDTAKLRKPPEFDGQYDPHVWFDVSLWIEAAKKVQAELSALKPELKELFAQNAKPYLASLEQLDKMARESIATIPKSQRLLITAHDAFGYFGRAYEIEVMGLQGISTATEYGLNDVTRLVDVIIERKVPAIFVESSVPKKFVEAIEEGVKAKKGQVKVGGELFSDAMGTAGTPEGTYVGMVTHNVGTIVKALK